MTQPPKVIHLDLLDTDYARIIAGEPIPEDRQRRLEATDPHIFKYLGKQIARYRYGLLDQEGKDDVLCNIASTVGLLTPADIEDINDRLRTTGHLYLTPGERLQVFNWLQDEFGITLNREEDES